jgi:putative hydrolase of the HAD superfamily
LSKLRFPTSCGQAYEQLAGTDADVEVREAVRTAAQGVFTRPARLVDAVREVLATLLANDWRLVMQTSGDEEIQHHRIAESELSGFFSEIRIVPKKSPETFQAILEADGRPVGQTWSVGNSLPSDINPALRAHMNAIWVPAHIWEHEKREKDVHQESGQLFEATVLSEILDILQPELAIESVVS